MEEQRRYWDVVKGTAIFSVVLGHCGTAYMSYIYLFHLPLFFFVSGYFYNEEKYGEHPIQFLKKRVLSQGIKYIAIEWFFIVIHNVLYDKQMLYMHTDTRYTLSMTMVEMIKTLLGGGQESMVGPLWFIPVHIMASFIFECIIFLGIKFAKSESRKIVLQLFAVGIIVMIGWILIKRNVVLFGHYEVSFLVVPFFWMGYLMRRYVKNVNTFVRFVPASLCMLMIVLVGNAYSMDLVFHAIKPEYILVSLMGIYSSLWLAKIMIRGKVLSELMSHAGRASFWIMVVHFPVIRLLDSYWAEKMSNPLANQGIPCGFPERWYVYLILGFVVPVLVSWMWAKRANLLSVIRL